MADITPGTGGTIKSATAEGQLQEILTFISIQQGSTTTNPGEAQNVLATHDQSSRLFAGTYLLSVSQSIATNGSLTLVANPYLVSTGFQVGTGGTFKSTTPEGYALEVLMYLQTLEQSSTANPASRNYITGSYNSDTGRYQGSFSIPCIAALDTTTGAVEYTAEEYLNV